MTTDPTNTTRADAARAALAAWHKNSDGFTEVEWEVRDLISDLMHVAAAPTADRHTREARIAYARDEARIAADNFEAEVMDEGDDA